MELERIAMHLLEQRLRMRDLSLEPLQRAADQLRNELPIAERPKAFLDRALSAASMIDFTFWSKTASDALRALPASHRADFYPHLCRRIAASFGTDRERRADLIDRLAKVVASAA